MKTVLFIFFIVNGQPVVLDGWYPINFLSEKKCESKIVRVEKYIKKVVEPSDIEFKVLCDTVENQVKMGLD